MFCDMMLTSTVKDMQWSILKNCHLETDMRVLKQYFKEKTEMENDVNSDPERKAFFLRYLDYMDIYGVSSFLLISSFLLSNPLSAQSDEVREACEVLVEEGLSLVYHAMSAILVLVARGECVLNDEVCDYPLFYIFDLFLCYKRNRNWLNTWAHS